MSILFLTLKVFSATGGIEKVCRIAGKALYEYGLQHNRKVSIFSMHGPKDAANNNPYFPAEIYTGFGGAKMKFVKDAVIAGKKSDTVILSHINLLLAGWLIKKVNPSVRIILIAHGIEVWKTLSPHKQHMLQACDHIACVSRFTMDKIKLLHNIPAEKCSVLNNCIDPFLARPEEKKRDPELVKRYGFSPDDIILLTLTRLSERDRYKGYDAVLRSMVSLIKQQPAQKKIKYLLAGGYDNKEKLFLDELIERSGLREHVILSGYIREEELAAHFSLADIYLMPSIKEGFGIVFVEAMYYGVPAIAGNADGSVDALLNGRLGLLINPEDPDAITEAVMKMIRDPKQFLPDHGILMEHFSYEKYKEKLEEIINEEQPKRETVKRKTIKEKQETINEKQKTRNG
ncbi:MAG: glycosyltransferase family 4 protein [Ferruginibacter sp.]